MINDDDGEDDDDDDDDDDDGVYDGASGLKVLLFIWSYCVIFNSLFKTTINIST